ncbi:MAG: hypothetical protein ACRCYU_02290 [Nocardioides sp.]
MNDVSGRSRQPAGVPTGGEFATEARAEATGRPLAEVRPAIGANRSAISVAEARRRMPVGSEIQVVFPGRRQDEPNVRTVEKQTPYEMVSGGSRNHWDGVTAEADESGAIILRKADGIPYAAYIPLDGRQSINDPEFADDLKSRHREARVSTDPQALAEIARSGIMRDREIAALNTHTPLQTLVELTDDPSVKVRRAVATNTNTPLGALDRLASDPDEDFEMLEAPVRQRVAGNPSASPRTLDRLADDKGPRVREIVADNPSTGPETLRRMADGLNWSVRESVARHKNTPPDVLARLGEPANGLVARGVARNPSAPPETLAHIAANTPSMDTRCMVGVNSSTPPTTLATLAVNDEPRVRRAVARNPSLAKDVAAKLAYDDDLETRVCVAKHSSHPTVLARLASDSEADVRRALARNPNVDDATRPALR